MDEFHATAERVFGVMIAAPAEPGRQQVEERAEAFAAGAEDVFAYLLDERNVGAQAFMDPVLHPLHVGLEFCKDILKGSDHLVSQCL